MVDALRAIHAVIRPGGHLVDARPDSSRGPRVIARGRVRGLILQSKDADERDARSDEAIAQIVAEGVFRPIRSGHLWFDARFADLAALDAYVRESGRYDRYAPGTRRALLPFRDGAFVTRRAIRFTVFERMATGIATSSGTRS